jgi:hypothetical protein
MLRRRSWLPSDARPCDRGSVPGCQRKSPADPRAFSISATAACAASRYAAMSIRSQACSSHRGASGPGPQSGHGPEILACRCAIASSSAWRLRNLRGDGASPAGLEPAGLEEVTDGELRAPGAGRQRRAGRLREGWDGAAAAGKFTINLQVAKEPWSGKQQVASGQSRRRAPRRAGPCR